MKSHFHSFASWLNLLLFILVVFFPFGGSHATFGQDDDAKQDQREEKVDYDQLYQSAMRDLNSENFAAAAKKLKQYTDEKKDDVLARFQFGYAAHMSGDLDTGIQAFQKIPITHQLGSTALYNLGCAYSLKNDPKKSIEYLHQAMDAGFDQFDLIDSDSDLDNVRKAEGFKEIQTRAANNGKRPKKELEARALVGNWAVISGTRQGERIAKDRLPVIIFTEKDLTIPVPQSESFVMSYHIVDASKEVVSVDFKIESGPSPEGTAVGIMKFAENKVQLCYDPTGKKRPTEFTTTAEDGNFSFVLEKKTEKFDTAKVNGSWRIVDGKRAGEAVPAERMSGAIKFEKGTITIPAENDPFVMSYEIDAANTPAHIDMKVESGPAPAGSQAAGILKFESGKLVLCYNATGGDRPAEFASTSKNDNFLFVMEAIEE